MATTQVSESGNHNEEALATRFLPPMRIVSPTLPRKKLQSANLRSEFTFETPSFFPIVTSRKTSSPRFAVTMKRTIDIFCSALGLLAVAPLMAVIAAFIKLDSRGPVFYCAPRAGKMGHSFVCVKFRTMINNANAMKAGLRSENERKGPFFKIVRDPRVTRLGKILRRYSLDELPQLWNVLIGEMSLVGPRPHPLDDCQFYLPHDLRRLDVTPGITGLWQVTARRDPSFQRNMALDLEYIERWSLTMDLQILFKTVFVVLQGTGA
jgi:lipopolysaccharide/colanic/teichoic acid biosynthesis glycosyltransferase